MKAHNRLEDKLALWEACRPRREKVIKEKGCAIDDGCPEGTCTAGSHCLVNPPAYDSKHLVGKAFDVSAGPLIANLDARQPPLSMAQFLAAPPEVCNLKWGGEFICAGGVACPDRVHFQLR
jgi:hypothetical protein